MKLVIGNKNYSSWSLRPWLLLKHFKLRFEEERVPLFAPGYKEKLEQYSSAGQVPVLVDDDVTIGESLAICEYVSEQYLGGAGWPAEPIPRAQARACSAGMHAGFTGIRTLLPMNVRASGRNVEITPVLEDEIKRLTTMWGMLRKASVEKGPWLFGEFSIADCMYAPIAFRFNTYGVALKGDAGEYCATLLNHAAMGEWRAQALLESEVIEAFEVGV